VPRIRRVDILSVLFAHLLDRIQERRIEARQLELLDGNQKSRLTSGSSASLG
jgi:hypothetical protein